MFKLLGVLISPISKRKLLEKIENTVKYGNPAIAENPYSYLFIVTANPEILVKAWKDREYRDILNSADIVVADGVGITLLARLLYKVKIERITGVDLASEILELASQYKKRVFILGGAGIVNQKALSNISNNSHLHIEGLGDNFSESETIARIKKFNPDVLFVALGAPKQELFIHNLLKTKNTKLKIPSIMMGIGGAIDFWAYPSFRAPKLLRRAGLEWLWRLFLQPWRLPRIINAVIIFPLIVLHEYVMHLTGER